MSGAVAGRDGGVDLAVVTVTWNSTRHLAEFARSLEAGCVGLRWLLVVADNDSADGTADAVEAMTWPASATVRVVRTGGNIGYAAGINAALAHVPDALPVLVSNPDVRFEEGTVGRLLRACGPSDVVVPLQLDGDGRVLPTLRRAPSARRAWGEALLGGHRAGRHGWGEMVTDPAAYRTATRADWASGSVLLLGSALRRLVEPWDERYFLYSEETDILLRAAEAGHPVRLVPDATCRHLLGDSHVSPRLWALLTVNRVRLVRRRSGPLATAAFRAGLAVGAATRLVATRQPTHAAALRALLRPSSRWGEVVRAAGGRHLTAAAAPVRERG